MGDFCDSIRNKNRKIEDINNPANNKNSNESNGKNLIQNNNNNINTPIISSNINPNNNSKTPQLRVYNPALITSIESKMSSTSSQGVEIISGGIVNDGFALKKVSCNSNDSTELIKEKSNIIEQKPLAESYSYYDINKNNGINYIDDRKAKTTIKSGKSKYPKMFNIDSKGNNINLNNSNKIKVSLNENGSSKNYNYVHIPMNDNRTIVDFGHISESNL